MYTIIFLVFCAFFAVGICVNFVLYRRETQHKKSTRFITSERLFVFFIEILIAIIGFGVTLAITNANEQQVEKDKAIRMLQQTIEYTDKQLTSERSYLNRHNRGEITTETLLVSNVINLDYYNNILSNEVVLQNANMNTYGDIMRYLAWVEGRDERAQTAEESEVYQHLYRRYIFLKQVRELLQVCCDEMSGKITAAEAAERCKEIKADQQNNNNSTAWVPSDICRPSRAYA